MDLVRSEQWIPGKVPVCVVQGLDNPILFKLNEANWRTVGLELIADSGWDQFLLEGDFY